MSEPSFASPLAHRIGRHGAQGLSIGLREITDRGMIDLRGLPDDPAFMGAARSVLGFDLPTAPRTGLSKKDVSILWLSVDQWLICLPRENAGSLAQSFTGALKGIHSLCADLSDARAIFRLEGTGARDVLNKGTSVDFTASGYGQGSVRRLRYAEIAAMVHVVATGPDVIDLYVFRSHADYAWDYLTTTAKDAARLTLFGPQDVPRT